MCVCVCFCCCCLFFFLFFWGGVSLGVLPANFPGPVWPSGKALGS